MKRIRFVIVALVASFAIGGGIVAGCASPASAPAEEAIHIEKLESGLPRLTLSAKAAERLAVETVAVEETGTRKVIPYAAVIYDAQGLTWAYAAVEALTFERAEIVVDEIVGDEAILSGGPAAGTEVVIVGAAELYGAETGVGGGH
jgi:hypothetical protein